MRSFIVEADDRIFSLITKLLLLPKDVFLVVVILSLNNLDNLSLGYRSQMLGHIIKWVQLFIISQLLLDAGQALNRGAACLALDGLPSLLRHCFLLLLLAAKTHFHRFVRLIWHDIFRTNNIQNGRALLYIDVRVLVAESRAIL